MKRVSFECAKALKEAGYPQGDIHSGNCDVYPLEDHDDNYIPYTRVGKLSTRYICNTFRVCSEIPYAVAPTYLEVWLWLWREKKIPIDLCSVNNERWAYFEQGINTSRDGYIYLDPEEAIIAAIEYLVTNNLIK